MAAKVRTGSRPGKVRRDDEPLERNIGCAVNAAIKLGFVVGREVLVGKVPGLVVGYNIAGMGSFLGNAYPLVVRTALGVTKCAVDEVSLA
ncbi:MAG: hypothetical protein KA806_03130 [Sulfuritalea sp.]|jgi:hypothetical protein|nr:hypothetical protein [Sulfuritalea sp.]